MSETKRKVPKLRFPGFTEDWEQRKLTDMSKTFIGLVTTMTANYREEGTLLIRNSDISDNKFIFSEKPIYLDSEFAKSNESRKLKSGDVVTVHTGDIGTSAVVEENIEGAIGFATINTRPDINYLNSHFLSTYFNTEIHKKYAISVATGDGRSNYNIKDFNKLMLYIPSVNEQKAIAGFVKSITNLITLHQRKLENLKLKKKALLQKLLPKNGEQFPELRFPGFTDAWEQRKLGELVEMISGDAPSIFTTGDNIYIKVDDLNYSDRVQISASNMVDINPKAHLVSKGATIFPKRGAAIMTNKVRIMGVDGYLDTNMMALIPDNIDKKFLFTFIQKTGLYKIADTSTIPQINNKHIEPYLIQVPSIKEQTYIGVIFEKLDNLITLHQRKLEHLQLQKKALLQLMFV